MRLSELFDAIKDCKTDPELYVSFDGRPAQYPVTGVQFVASIRAATVADFQKQAAGVAGPAMLVIECAIPKPRDRS